MTTTHLPGRARGVARHGATLDDLHVAEAAATLAETFEPGITSPDHEWAREDEDLDRLLAGLRGLPEVTE